VVGDVMLGAHSSALYGAVLHGDIQRIAIGHHSNIQDNAVPHLAEKPACIIVNRVTVARLRKSLGGAPPAATQTRLWAAEKAKKRGGKAG
jgi:formaldehyde-activating enzyme involved in methanogenesis